MKSRRLPDTDPSEQLDVSAMNYMKELALDDRVDWLRNEIYDRLADKWASNYDRFDDLHNAVGAAIERKVAKIIKEGQLAI